MTGVKCGGQRGFKTVCGFRGVEGPRPGLRFSGFQRPATGNAVSGVLEAGGGVGRTAMKKIGIYCLALLCAVSLVACKGGAAQGEEVGASIEASEGTQASPQAQNGPNEADGTGSEAGTEAEPQEERIVSYLTGLEVTEKEREQRPLAVMFNNLKAGCPQAGIADAGVIYEAPVEGADVTRLMGIFEDWQGLERLGSIRSSRDYFVYCALEFDAIYAHFGQATPYDGD